MPVEHGLSFRKLKREVNGRILDLATELGFEESSSEATAFCECERPDCLQRIQLTLVEFQWALTPGCWLVAADHAKPSTEHVIQRRGTYAVVRPALTPETSS